MSRKKLHNAGGEGKEEGREGGREEGREGGFTVLVERAAEDVVARCFGHWHDLT